LAVNLGSVEEYHKHFQFILNYEMNVSQSYIISRNSIQIKLNDMVISTMIYITVIL